MTTNRCTIPPTRPARHPLWALLLAGGLTACGGGGGGGGGGNDGGGPPVDPPPMPVPVTSLACSGADGHGWCWQAPQPGAVALADAHFVDDQRGWAVGDGGTVLHTTDGGLSWQRQLTDVDDRLSLVRFADAQSGWAFATRGATVYTRDGGRRWTRGPDLSGGALNAWVRADGGVVVQSAGKAGMSLLPGDATWTALPLQLQTVVTRPDGSWQLFGAQQAADGSLPWGWLEADGRTLGRPRGVAAGQVVQDMGRSRDGSLWASVARLNLGESGYAIRTGEPQVLGSTDGGATWSLEAALPDGPDLPFVSYPLFGWGGGGQGLASVWPLGLARTTDGGLNWTKLDGSSHYGNRQWVLATQDGSSFSASADLGRTWTALPSTPLRPRTVLDDESGALLIATQQDQVLRSTDGGRSFTRTPFVDGDNDTVLMLHFFDARRGLAVTASGRLLDTTDGGQQWLPRSADALAPLQGRSVHVAPGGTLWAHSTPADDGAVSLLRSTDAGAHWDRLPLKLPDEALGGTLRALRFVNDRVAWMDVTRTDFSNYSFGYCRNFYVRCGPTESTLYVSEDGGATWSRRARFGLLDALHPVALVTADLAFKMNNSGALLRSTNGGRDWSPVAEGVVTFQNENPVLYFVDALHGWLALSGRILRTDDGGAHWQATALPMHLRGVSTPSNLPASSWGPRALHFADAQHGYAVGDDQMVLRTDDGGRSWTPQPSASGIPFHAVFMLDAQRAWIGGGRGAILATTTGGH